MSLHNSYLLFAIALTIASFILIISPVQALTITDVNAETLEPGKEGLLSVTLKNNLDIDLEDVTLSLDFSLLSLSPGSSSEDNVNELDEGDSEILNFIIRASPSTKAGDYTIPYTLSAKNFQQKKGTIGIKVRAKSELEYIANLDNPFVGEKSKLTVKIVNKGKGDAQFLSIKIVPDGYTLLSEDSIYIGNVDSDDFETASFDTIITRQYPVLIASVTYEDIENNKLVRNLVLPLTAYTAERAIELGIRKNSYSFWYIALIILLILLWFIRRAFKRRKRLKQGAAAIQSGR